MAKASTRFSRRLGIEYPIICGAMYPCGNPELVAAASAAGGIGIVQPMSVQFVHKHDLREGLRLIKSITDKPFGFNAIVEKSVKAYENRMREWVDIAIEEGVSLFITALGNPSWVVARASEAGIPVYHDVTERKWALKALDAGVEGLICVNGRAGGHAGDRAPEALYEELQDLGVPLICAGGVGDPETMKRVLDLGYDGVQMGTRFIASHECNSHESYKQAILDAEETDIVLTDKLSGVPCTVINNEFLEKTGAMAGPIARRLLQGRKTKHWMRTYYSLKSLFSLKNSALKGGYKDYWLAGKSVGGIKEVKSVAEIMAEFAAVLDETPAAEATSSP